MNLKNIKIELPGGWKEASRMGSEDQVIVRVFHSNPLANIDPKTLEDQSLDSKSGVYVTKLAVPTPGVRPIGDFYKNMKSFIDVGLMPPEWTPQKLDTLWKGMTESANAERPGESDLANDIEIIQCKDEETAWQALKNRALTPTQGLDVPIPGGNVMIPGMPKNVSMGELFQSDLMKQFIPKEQLANFSKMQSVIGEAQKQMPGIKQNLEKKGVKYREGKLFGCKAVFLDSPNLSSPSAVTPAGSSTKGNADGMGMGGPTLAGGEEGPSIPPLPKFKQSYSATISSCMGILHKNFIIGGPLLLGLDNLPAGNTPCYSLTRNKEIRETIKEDGKSLISVTIVPLPSTYAQEGYFHKEEVEEIYKNIISKLK